MYIAAFIDRDGTINKPGPYVKSTGKKYILKEEDIKLIDKVPEAIRLLNKNKIKVIIITNQGQVGKGLMTAEKAEKINNHVCNILREKNAVIDASYICMHQSKDLCECRKPNPGMILKAAAADKINLKKSYVIGDRQRDIEAGKKAGCRTIMVETGEYAAEEYKKSRPDFKVKSLYEAARVIIGK